MRSVQRTAPRGLLLALALAACHSGGGPPPEAECAGSLDCLGWATCSEDGRCVPAPACETRADCARDDGCGPNGWCAAARPLDAAGVVLWGDTQDPHHRSVLAPVLAPTHVVQAVPPDAIDVKLGPSGELLYRRVDRETLVTTFHRLVPDAWVWSTIFDGWTSASYPAAGNDPVVRTPACREPAAWLVRAGTGELAYTCPGAPLDWFDEHERTVVTGWELRAWNGAGWKLATLPGEDLALYLLDPANASGGPMWDVLDFAVHAVRAHGDGFRVFANTRQAGGGRPELWFFSGSTRPRLEGTFAFEAAVRREVTIEGFYGWVTDPVLDGEGTVWRYAWSIDPGGGGGTFRIFRCGLDAPACEVVSDETTWAQAIGAEDSPDRPPQRYAFPDGPFAELLTGP